MENIKISNEATDIIDEIFGETGFKSAVVNVQKVNTKGGNFLGNLLTVEINENERKVNLFVKVAPNIPEIRALMDINKAYNNEIFSYIRLKNCYMKLQKDFDILNEERYEFAELFGYKKEKGFEAIILEDLKFLGYQMHDRMKPINMNYMLETINKLAKFHALSLAAQKYKPDFFEREIVPIRESILSDFHRNLRSEELEADLDAVFENILQTVKEEHRENLRTWCYSESKNTIEKAFHTKRNVSVLCHGDFRSENIFVKFDMNGVVSSVIPIDYQMVYYGSPTNDLIFLIFTAAPTELRRKHINHWFEHYYKQLKVCLERFSMELDGIYPMEVYERDFKDSLPYGLHVAVFLLHKTLTDPNDVEDMSFDDLMGKDKRFFAGKVYQDRISGIVEDFVNSGYLNNFQQEQKTTLEI